MKEQTSDKVLTRRVFLKKALLPLAALSLGLAYSQNPLDSLPPTTSATKLLEGDPQQLNKYSGQRYPLPIRVNGINFPSWQQGEYRLRTTLESLKDVAEINPNLIGIIPTQYQDNINSTFIRPTTSTATTLDLEVIINSAHRLGYPVMLAPQINLLYDPEHWHGEIGINFTGNEWQSWFKSYRNMIYSYATLAEKTQAEMLVVGNEYFYASKQSSDWIATIQEIRKRYTGAITYASHFYEFDSIDWWQELDFMGLNPYYGLTDQDNPTPEELKISWEKIVQGIEPTVKRWDKRLLFPEIGYPSYKGSNQHPWNYQLINEPTIPVDLEEQTNAIKTLYEAFLSKPWWYGVVWWNWPTDPNAGGLNDKNYTPKGKPAAKIIRDYSILNQNLFP